MTLSRTEVPAVASIDQLSTWAANLKWEEVSGELRSSVKTIVVDTLSVALAASKAAGVKDLSEMVTEWSGRPESYLWGQETRVPVPWAALVNGTMSHALDYDETHDEAGTHLAGSVVPVALALAERDAYGVDGAQRVGVRGQAVLAGILAGLEVGCRIQLAVERVEVRRGWHPTAVIGTFASAVAGARVLGLGPKGINRALGIAYSMCAGTRQVVADGALTKRMHPGFAAKSGAMAAIMAARGIDGVIDPLCSRYGFYSLYHEGSYDLQTLVGQLGKRFEAESISLKPYPCCRFNHAPISAAKDLRQGYLVGKTESWFGEDIKAVRVHVTQYVADLVDRYPGADEGARIDAQFSIPYCVAVMLVKGAVRIEDFSVDALKDPLVREVMSRVTVLSDRVTRTRQLVPVRVELELHEGSPLTQLRTSVPGSSEDPMTNEDFLTKVEDCISHGIDGSGRVAAMDVVDRVNELEGLNLRPELCRFT
ncbi:MAG: MmgE/PrpD family protein [Trueperaceae bacterium]